MSTILESYSPVNDTDLQQYSVVNHDDALVVLGTETAFEEIKTRVDYVLDTNTTLQ